MIIGLAILTSVYLVLISFEDLWERKIYSFPAMLFTPLWMSVIALNKAMNIKFFAMYLTVTLIMYAIFNVKHIWGAGDSDLFLMFSMIYFVFHGENFGITSLCTEILLFATVLIIAIAIGFVESLFKKEKLTKKSAIAVAPGFAVVIIAVIWKGVMGC